MEITVLINGAKGKMGSEAVKTVTNSDHLTLVAQCDASDNLASIISDTQPQVMVDLTHPDAVKQNTETALLAGVHTVVGTSGLSESDLSYLSGIADEQNVGLLVVPNFAIGAVLMMKFAAEAAVYMPQVEICEMHHDQKADAPSGTAVKTADLIHSRNPNVNEAELSETELISGARGGRHKNVPIHSVRLPGYVASQEVTLGGLGQTLKIRHDSISRDSFMPGVVLAIEKVTSIKGLVYGLENIL